MKTANYHIYVIQEHFDTALGTNVQRWSLAGKSISRRIALYKARRRALLGDYSKIEVVKRAFNENDMPIKSKIIWQYKEEQSAFALRMKHKAGLFGLRRHVKL
jgi:hypothetical protein